MNTKYVKSYGDSLLEKKKIEKWSKKVHIKKGGMHELLGLEEGENIDSKYTSGEGLVKALLKATDDDRQKVSGMINFAANAAKNSDSVFKKAQTYLSESSEKEKEKKD